jgi:uncharacterized protein YdcH (DUF465 family)
VKPAFPDAHAIREVPMSQGSLREQLLESNEEYRRLNQQHHDYETRLVTLADKAVLTDDEHVEEVTLKKKKLQIKDRMEAIARQVQETAR